MLKTDILWLIKQGEKFLNEFSENLTNDRESVFKLN